MMMERAKTAPAPETTSTQHEKPALGPAKNASAEERVQDLERRLNLLDADVGAAKSSAAAAPAATKPAAPAASQTGKNNPLLKRIQAAQERARLAEQKERESKAAAAAEAQRKQREAEEARLRAAEEARIAKAQSALRSVAGRALEDKQRDILAQLEGKKAPPAPPAPAMVALPPAPTMVAPPAFAPPAMAPPQEAAATPGVPIMKTMDPPPPSFDSMKFPPPKMQQPVPNDGMVGHGMNSRMLSDQGMKQPPPPPSFDVVEKQLAGGIVPPSEAFPPPPAPTAPAMSPSAPPHTMEAHVDHLHGIQPVAPPPFDPMTQQQPTTVDAMPPPPSFAEFEQSANATNAQNGMTSQAMEDEGFLIDVDENGNPLSMEQRQAMLDEQRQLYESIRREKEANDAAIARAQADAFDQRSSSAAARSMPGGSDAQTQHVQRMDQAGMDVAGAGAAAAGGAAAASAEQAEGQAAQQGERRMVRIGQNQMVALHGQDKTKKAIKEGTAILVQCINCQNWMQVTNTATLMFCPVCQVVSPVIQQNEVLTKEEAIQLTMDRKLAEKLQQEAYDQEEKRGEGGEANRDVWTNERGFLSGLFGGKTGEAAATSATASSAAASGAAAAGAQSDSWWNKISSIVSYGVADGEQERGEMGVTRPPGAPPTSQYPAERRNPDAATASINDSASRSPTHGEETRGLLSPVVVDGNEANLPSGRVAEQRPLFSCMVDSVSNAASAVFSTGATDGEADASSFIVTSAGRGVGDGAGDYEKLPDQE